MDNGMDEMNNDGFQGFQGFQGKDSESLKKIMDNLDKFTKTKGFTDKLDKFVKRKKIIDNDRRLQDLSIYQLTRGMTVPVNNIEDILPVFYQFKNLVQRGSFSLDQLEDMVLGRFGISDEPQWYDDIEFLEEEPVKYYK